MEILKNGQFLKLWGNQVLLQIAFNMCNFTALLLIDQNFHSRFALAGFYVAMTLPAFLVGIFSGAIVDMTNRKNLMLITDFVLALLFFSYAFLTQGNYVLLLGVAFLSASVAQFFTPAEAATIPEIVSGKDLEKANALFLFTGLGSVMLGYALVGPVVQYFGGLSGNGPEAAFIIAGIVTFIGFFLRLSLKSIQTTPPVTIDGRLFYNALALTKEVITVTRGNAGISLPIILLTIMEFNIGLLAILFIDFVTKYLHVQATSTSYLLILPLIIGLGIGVSLLGILQKRLSRGLVISVGGMLFGMIILLLGIIPKLVGTSSADIDLLRVVTVIGSGIIGIAAVFVSVHARTVLQENTPHAMLGRVFSLVTIAASAITPIPILLVSLITEKVDVTTVFMVLGVVLTVATISSKSLLHRKLV